MRWFELQRIRRALPVAAGLFLVAACGGNDNGGGLGPGNGGGLAGNYELVGINEDAIPEEEQMEDCAPTLFTGGSMTMDGDGNFELSVEYQQFEGPDGWQDHGTFERHEDGGLSFDSEAWGDHFEGEVDGDLVVLYYDFCTNGVHDIDLVFER
jgi:hypothetical protein